MALIVVAIATVIAGLGASVAPAHAMYTYAQWNAGSSRWGYTGGTVVVRTGYRFDVPVLIISHNGATSLNQQQHVTVRHDLQRWSGSAVNVGGMTQRPMISTGADGVAITTTATLVPNTYTPGWYRVVTTINWNGQSNLPNGSTVVTGYHQFAPNLPGEMVCAQPSASCTAGTGWVWVSA